MRALHRHTRRWLVGAVSVSVVVLTLLGSGTALAAKPNLTVTGDAAPGTAGDKATTAQPTVVSTNETIQFTTSIFNADTSNVSQLYFDLLGVPSGFTVSKVTSTTPKSKCSTTTFPLCTFAALRPGLSAQVTVILTAPASTTGAPTECTVGSDGYQGSTALLTFGGPAFCITGRWSANGAPSSDGGTSHGDYFNWFDGAGLNGDATNFLGRYVFLNGQKVVGNNLNVSSANKQGTQATVNQLNLPVTVLDGPDAPSIICGADHTVVLTDGTTFDCTTLTSETSVVEVARGNTINLFSILVKFNQAPTNLKGNTPFVIHQYTNPANPSVLITEKISAICIYNKSGVPTNAPPACITVSNGGKQVVIWNDHNGKFQF